MRTKAEIQKDIDHYTGLRAIVMDREKKIKEAINTLLSLSTSIKYELDEGSYLIKESYLIAGDKYDQYVKAEEELVEQARSSFEEKKTSALQELEAEKVKVENLFLEYTSKINNLTNDLQYAEE